MDVPTVVSDSSLQQLTAEQIVDIPVSGRAGGGGRGGLQGFLPGQNSAAFYVKQTVDIPVPRSGGLQGSRRGQGSSASSSRLGVADEAGQGFFRTFPRWKKSAGLGPHSRSELGADFNRQKEKKNWENKNKWKNRKKKKKTQNMKNEKKSKDEKNVFFTKKKNNKMKNAKRRFPRLL